MLAYNQAAVLEGGSSGVLRAAQERFHTEYGVEESIKTLAAPIEGKPPVTLFYTMTEDPSQDTVVDVVESSETLQKIAQQNGLILTIFQLDVGHVNMYQQHEQYDAFIAQYVNPNIERSIYQQEGIAIGVFGTHTYTPLLMKNS